MQEKAVNATPIKAQNYARPIISKWTKIMDRVVGWFIKAGGILVIMIVVSILVLIVKEALPLFNQPQSRQITALDSSVFSRRPIMAIGVDEYLETVFVLDDGGVYTFIDVASGRIKAQHVSPTRPDSAASIRQVWATDDFAYAIQWNDGQFGTDLLTFVNSFNDNNQRQSVSEIRTLTPLTAQPNIRQAVVRQTENGSLQAILTAANQIQLTWIESKADIFGNTTSSTLFAALQDSSWKSINALTLDSAGDFMCAGTTDGFLLSWNLREAGQPIVADKFLAFGDKRAITTLTYLLGDNSLIVGDAQGTISVWFSVVADGVNRLTQIRSLTGHDTAVTALWPSSRQKAVVSLANNGDARFNYATTARELLYLQPDSPISQIFLAPRGDGFVTLDQRHQLTLQYIDNPHPEASRQTLFERIWYENHEKPAYVWQSSSGTEDSEPKLSLMPLIFGTLKGTFYALLFAVPLALSGAIYTSYLMAPRFRQIVKPAVEMMAAIPSVVIGFLTALWLAPMVERNLLGLLILTLILPTLLIIFLIGWERIHQRPRFKTMSREVEFILLMPVILIAVSLSLYLNDLFSRVFFAGDFKNWLFETLQIQYDQRNCIIISFGLGFAVIPIIFTIAEDSLSNVPKSLSAAALALGASRWQTAWRVIVPSALPGIFAGIMIGFGRAIGETMIVLMATGNTPIMDWSIFNGMRTLSANIAVEIPEAPYGGTLYRILFLSAVLLFIITFTLNTAAEIVRARMRKKYGKF